MMWNSGDWWHWGWGLHWGFGIFFWGLLALAVFALFRTFRAHRLAPGTAPGQSALEILKLRYARGELSREDYRAMCEEITD